MAPIKLSWPDWEYPKWLDKKFKTSRWWVEQKRQDDGAEGLWRIHDGIYDLSKWADSHPGGKSWINLTRGLDVTEIFEASHLEPMVEELMKTFFVRNAQTPRNSPYTFEPDGFFRTLKGRVYEKVKNHRKGPGVRTLMFIDAFVAVTFILSILAAKFSNYYIGIIAGVFLTGSTILAHNFFHQKDHWRMYYFQLSLMSVTDWRISHGLSHHIFTNTRLDLEIIMMEPILQWFPKEDKNAVVKYLSWIYSPLFYSSLYMMQALTRFVTQGFEREDLISFLLPSVMYLFSGADIISCIGMWLWIIVCGSFVFGSIGFNVAHHHPDIFHEGDRPRKDRDWGLNQLDAVSDRIEVAASFPWAHLSFGDHTLHHLFPTVDHEILPKLYPIFTKTCQEFGVEFRYRTTLDLISGQFRQLKRTTVNDTPREEIKAPVKLH